jgi:hypothetical protein
MGVVEGMKMVVVMLGASVMMTVVMEVMMEGCGGRGGEDAVCVTHRHAATPSSPDGV